MQSPWSCLQIFGSREKAQLDVYGIWAVLRNQLHTDDSFVFNRVVGRIKESVSHLPEATPEDDGALQDIKVGSRLAPNAHECLAPREWPQ